MHIPPAWVSLCPGLCASVSALALPYCNPESSHPPLLDLLFNEDASLLGYTVTGHLCIVFDLVELFIFSVFRSVSFVLSFVK